MQNDIDENYMKKNQIKVFFGHLEQLIWNDSKIGKKYFFPIT